MKIKDKCVIIYFMKFNKLFMSERRDVLLLERSVVIKQNEKEKNHESLEMQLRAREREPHYDCSKT